MSCPPGEHTIPWGRYGHTICAPDVPGAGLPWDLPTALCALGALIFFLIVIGWLGYLMWRDRGVR